MISSVLFLQNGPRYSGQATFLLSPTYVSNILGYVQHLKVTDTPKDVLFLLWHVALFLDFLTLGGTRCSTLKSLELVLVPWRAETMVTLWHSNSKPWLPSTTGTNHFQWLLKECLFNNVVKAPRSPQLQQHVLQSFEYLSAVQKNGIYLIIYLSTCLNTWFLFCVFTAK